MRTDATIDRQQVICPNASHLGYDKTRAQFGDIVVFKETSTSQRIGRVAGRIKFAPACGETLVIRGYLLVMVISDNLTAVCERWVNPKDVLSVHSRVGTAWELMSFVLSHDFTKHSPDTLRAWSESGFNTPQQYYNYRANQNSGRKS